MCSKNDVILKRELQLQNVNVVNANANSNTFIIDFEINNSRIDLERFCNFNIFKLMFELNREDAIQDLRITDHGGNDDGNNDDNVKDMLLIFKRKGDDIGIKQKYMNLRLTLNTTSASTSTSVSNFVFGCVDTEPIYNSSDIGTDLSRAERICDIGAVFCMSLLDRNRLRIQFMFSVPAPAKQQPSYIENSLGMVMKKILSRVKTFIEQM